MNSFEVLQDSKKSIENVYNAIFNYLKTVADAQKTELKIEAPSVATVSQQFKTLGLLRFTSTKGQGTYPLGFSDPEFPAIWAKAFPPKPVDSNGAIKSHEFELMKALFVALDPELKAQGYVVDPKTAMIQEGLSLGGWQQLQVEQSIKLPIVTPDGKLVFEIPLISMEYAKKFTKDYYGFKEDARVLVVDDSMVARRYSRSCLAMAGYFNIVECPDGQAGFSKITGTTPPIELVIADWHMPVMSGIELLKKVRAEAQFKKLPIIMLTGEKNKEEVVNAIKEGATGYLIKPAPPEHFFKALKKAGGLG